MWWRGQHPPPRGGACESQCVGAAGFEKAPLELQGGHAPHSENHDRCMTGASGELLGGVPSDFRR